MEGLELETFPCDICGKEFYKRNKLNEHMKVHEGETTCDLCHKVFSNVGTMRKHKDRGSCQKWNGQQLDYGNDIVTSYNNKKKVPSCNIFLVAELHTSHTSGDG